MKTPKIKTESELKQEKLLSFLENNQPIGKHGAEKAVIPDWPDEITMIFSTEETKVPKIKEITIQELFNIKTIPIQRRLDPTRLNKNMKYLSDESLYCIETGREFTAVRLPDGRTFLIDGNSRVANYYNEMIRFYDKKLLCRWDIPSTVTLVIHDVDSMEDAELLYYTFDNNNAVETAGHKMGGVIETLDIKFTNSIINKANYKQGLKNMASFIPGITIEKIPSIEYGIFKEFSAELEYIDKNAEFGVPGKPMGGDDLAIIVGMLRKNRVSVLEKKNIMVFANCIASPIARGSIKEKSGEKNAIAHLHEEYFATKANRRFEYRSTKRKQLFGLWVFYYQMWCNDEMSKSACALSENKLVKIADEYLKS